MALFRDGWGVWQQKGVETRKPGRKRRPPLDGEALRELALAYVGRFATTRSKLAAYLRRKLRERGWAGEREPDVALLVESLAERKYVDDEAFALAKSRSLVERGYGSRRVRQALHAAGVDEEDGAEARSLAEEQSAQAALRFARRRRLGPFAEVAPDRERRDKALAAMVRAGHDFDLSRAIIDLAPGCDAEEELTRQGRLA